MIPPKKPTNEIERLAEVKQYNLLDTLPEKDFDNITSLLASICEVPISLITLLDSDRNFLKSHFGIAIKESPRDLSLCAHAILQEKEVFIIEDTRKDERFKDNPILQKFGTVFYAGAPLINKNGYPLGTLCIYDTKPRKLSYKQIKSIILLSKQVVNLFELHSKNNALLEYQIEQQKRNERLHQFAHLVSHDLKSPLANITSLTRLLRDENEGNLNEDSLQYLEYIEESSLTLKNYITGILDFYNAGELLDIKKEDIAFSDLFNEIKEMLVLDNIHFTYPNVGTIKNVNKAALTQIILNLVDNALKYNDKEQLIVNISYSESPAFHKFIIKDNGIGVNEDIQEDIFEMFKTSGTKDRNGNVGTGIGLATVYSLVTKLGGQIWLDSEINKGSTFTFTLKK
ncbi:GAF domain-containing sensor histidine kinase [Ulvibacter litoralis]|uniref:histidine kinase n=1 Tax=Ulvibacter litoralis TaxID=227084 RepID=A0A1G7F9I9_9FLAO|nr:GAF domain-containing sensor histidine kinase [Ulvibacter litoralis]GHC52134.1 sensor histidine kinase [Ulvibacter litoralis]SDE72526.1 GAF domain-containing protein [Ulvibacter litoralis]